MQTYAGPAAMKLGQHAGQHVVRSGADESEANRADFSATERMRADGDGIRVAEEPARVDEECAARGG